MKKGIFQSILLRYMISYAAIMAVLFIGVGIFMNNSYANSIRTSLVDTNINRLSTLQSQHEEKLNTLQNIGNQLSISHYVSPFQLEKDPMKAYHLKLQLAPYAVTNDFCDQLYLIFNVDDYLYSSATTVGIDIFVEKLMRYDRLSPDGLRALLRRDEPGMVILPRQAVHSVLIDGTQSRMVTVLVPMRVGDRYSTGNVLFLINDKKYQQMFAEEIHEDRNTYIFHGGAVLSAQCDLPLSDKDVFAALSEGGEAQVQEILLEGGRYLLIAQYSPRYDMHYATVIPRQTLQAHMTRSQLGFGLFLFALSIPCILLTFYFARRHTKPIKELRLLFASAVPAQDDFEAIQSGITELVIRNETLSTRLTEGIPVQKSSFIASFVKGHFGSRDEAIRQAALLGMDIDQPCYLVALVDAGRDDEGVPEFDFDQAIACGEGQVTGYGVQQVALELYLFAIFARSDEALERWAWQMKALQPGASKRTVSISRVRHDFQEAPSAYLEASTAYDNRFVMGSANVLRFADVSAAAKDIVPFTRTYLDGFRKALQSRDERALSDRIHELFQYLTNTELSLFAFRMVYNNVIGVLLGEYYSQQGTHIDALQYYDVFTLSSCRSINDLDDILRKLCKDILSGEDKGQRQVHPLVRDIIAYMGEHFTDPTLSMSAIADHYDISAVRLSLDFKEITGMSPSEYLLLLRMEKAKELLGGTALSIKDIGAAVGYYDASGFIRRFKRYTAMTPAQYRKTLTTNHVEEKDETDE